MKGFEMGMPVLEKRPEKLEEDAEVKNEEVLLKESFGDLESVAQDLERIFAENPGLLAQLTEVKSEQGKTKKVEVKSEQGKTKKGLKKESLKLKKQERIKELSLMKEGVIARLKKEFKSIDGRKDFSPEELKGRRGVFYDKISGELFTVDDKGIKKNIKLGDLIGDYEWGIKYAPDISMPEKSWRKIRKILSLYETRNDLRKIFNQELSLRYSVGGAGAAFDLRDINSLIKRNVGGVEGHVAERMIVEFLTRIQYNNPELRMKIEKSNALEDVFLKYDFKIELRKKFGIALESIGVPREQYVRNKKRLGIQFTVGGPKKAAEIQKGRERLKKFEQLLGGRVDDIVLVQIPELKEFLDLYKKWVADGKPSSGPEQYLTQEQKLDIFKRATKGLFNLSEEELQKLII